MFPIRLKQLRDAKGWTQSELADKIGMKKSAISNYENGERDPQNNQIWQSLANALDTTVDYLMGRSDINILDDEWDAAVVELPILAEVSAGIGSYADVGNVAIGTEKVPRKWISEGENYVLLKVKGDSMFPRFEEDDLLLVRYQSSVDSGSYAVAIIDGDAGVVKKVVYGDSWIELQSLNPQYSPRLFEGSEVQRVRIFGLVKKSIRNYN